MILKVLTRRMSIRQWAGNNRVTRLTRAFSTLHSVPSSFVLARSQRGARLTSGHERLDLTSSRKRRSPCSVGVINRSAMLSQTVTVTGLPGGSTRMRLSRALRELRYYSKPLLSYSPHRAIIIQFLHSGDKSHLWRPIDQNASNILTDFFFIAMILSFTRVFNIA